ncbi:nuclease [Thauera sp. UPWRP]|nr:nuclease [Thauera sp. UPWRP]
MTAHYGIEQLHVDELHAWENNARTHSDEQIEQIARSIREFGWTNPVLIDEHNQILAGHGRVAAARRLGIHVVPCLRLDFMDDAQKKAYVIADNQLALNAGWDFDTLRVELEDLRAAGFDLDLTGFDDLELDAIFSGAAKGKDEDGEPQEFTLKVWSKDEAEILAVKKLLGINATAAKVEAERVIGMLRRA